MFKPNTPFRKVGTIGDFWEQGKNKTKLWQDIRDIEKRIGEGLEKLHLKRLSEYVYEMLGQTVSIRKLERSFGYSAESPTVQGWIDRLLAEEWAEEDG